MYKKSTGPISASQFKPIMLMSANNRPKEI